MSGSTTVELVQELRKLKQTPGVRTLTFMALDGVFHDFLTALPCPKMELVEELRRVSRIEGGPNAPKLISLVDRVKRGEFDGEKPGDLLPEDPERGS